MFVNKNRKSPSLSCISVAMSAAEAEKLDNWAKLRRLLDRVYQHACGLES